MVAPAPAPLSQMFFENVPFVGHVHVPAGTWTMSPELAALTASLTSEREQLAAVIVLPARTCACDTCPSSMITISAATIEETKPRNPRKPSAWRISTQNCERDTVISALQTSVLKVPAGVCASWSKGCALRGALLTASNHVACVVQPMLQKDANCNRPDKTVIVIAGFAPPLHASSVPAAQPYAGALHHTT